MVEILIRSVIAAILTYGFLTSVYRVWDGKEHATFFIQLPNFRQDGTRRFIQVLEGFALLVFIFALIFYF